MPPHGQPPHRHRPDPPGDHHRLAGLHRTGPRDGVHGHPAIPLRLRHRIVGALDLFQPTPHRLGDDDIALARALADVATIAILQQRTLERSHVENSRLQTALTSRVLIERVKGVPAERWDTSVDDAFAASGRTPAPATCVCRISPPRSSRAASTPRPSRRRCRTAAGNSSADGRRPCVQPRGTPRAPSRCGRRPRRTSAETLLVRGYLTST
ncbi:MULTISPECIES: GAF domain-containing protein [unclassified Streptomyces]|uniref:GAF domain-containing protein n=1 Tax=unclassified Streptomyces TaxID=2593676 RepID=UPI003B634629